MELIRNLGMEIFNGLDYKVDGVKECSIKYDVILQFIKTNKIIRFKSGLDYITLVRNDGIGVEMPEYIVSTEDKDDVFIVETNKSKIIFNKSKNESYMTIDQSIFEPIVVNFDKNKKK